MLEDPKVFLESLQGALGKFSKVDRETMKAFGNLNETANALPGRGGIENVKR